MKLKHVVDVWLVGDVVLVTALAVFRFLLDDLEWWYMLLFFVGAMWGMAWNTIAFTVVAAALPTSSDWELNLWV